MDLSGRTGRLLLGLAGYAAALAVALAVLGTGQVENTAGSPQALLRLTGAGVLWVLVAYVGLPRLLSPGLLRSALRGGVVALVLAGALGSTLRTTTVDEAAPDLVVAAAPAPLGVSPSPATASQRPTTPVATPDAASGGAVGTPTPTPAAQPVAPRPVASAQPPRTPAPAPAPAQAVRLGSGELAGINHKGQGRAVLIRLGDGSGVVRLEALDVENAPDMRVWLVRGADRERTTGGVDLGRLKGNKGNQNYGLPAGTDLSAGDWTVLIWCRAFAVPIANATVAVA